MRQTERAIYVTLPETAIDALSRVAHRERRHPRGQAAVLILESLRRAGALPTEPTESDRPSASLAAAGQT